MTEDGLLQWPVACKRCGQPVELSGPYHWCLECDPHLYSQAEQISSEEVAAGRFPAGASVFCEPCSRLHLHREDGSVS